MNARDVDGRTPLHFTTFTGKEDLLAELIESGANVNQTDNNGKTALHEAVDHGAVDLIQKLIDAKVNLNQTTTTGQTALHIAATISMLILFFVEEKSH